MYGPLPTDRPNYLKLQGTYDLPWGTSIGLFQTVAQGTPMSTEINWNGFGGNNQGGVFVNGRGDLGRTPVYTQTDLYLSQDVKLPLTHSRVNVNLNVSNLFDQMTVTDDNHAPYRDKLIAPGQSTAGSSTQLSAADAFFFNGFDADQVAAAMRASGATVRDNPLFLHPSSFLGRRSIRFGVKWTF